MYEKEAMSTAMLDLVLIPSLSSPVRDRAKELQEVTSKWRRFCAQKMQT